jgi:hypothetical protein
MALLNIMLLTLGIGLLVFTFAVHVITDPNDSVLEFVALYLISIFGIWSGLEVLLI